MTIGGGSGLSVCTGDCSRAEVSGSGAALAAFCPKAADVPCGTKGLALATKGTSGRSSVAVSILIGTVGVIAGSAGPSTSNAGLRPGRSARCLRIPKVVLAAGGAAEGPAAVSTRRGVAAPSPSSSEISDCRLSRSMSIAGASGCNAAMADSVSTVSVGLPNAAGAGVTMSMMGAGAGGGA
jgi:hypothetical protein